MSRSSNSVEPIAESRPEAPKNTELGPSTMTAEQHVPEAPAFSVFSTGMKWFMVTLAGISAIFSPISSNIFVPAIPLLAKDFHRTESDISLAVTIYLIFQAITPSLFGALSDTYGRRPLYIVVLVTYLGSDIGLALCPTSAYWLLLLLRALQATGGSAVVAIGAGTVIDITEPHEKGKFMALFQASAMLGPTLGPLLGGVFAQTLGWRAIFWFLAIATGVVLVPLVFLMPETLRSLVGNGSIAPPRLCMSPAMLWKTRDSKTRKSASNEEISGDNRPPSKPFKPLSAFTILRDRNISLVYIFVSGLFLEFYCALTVFSTALKDKYGLNELEIGLCYLPAGVGLIASTFVIGRQQDLMYAREMRRVNGDHRKRPDFRLEQARLLVIVPYAILFLVSVTAMGWCLQVKAPLAATLVMNFLMGIGTGTIGPAMSYAQDLKPGQGGASSASLNLVRCLFAAVGTAVVLKMYRSPLGAGWTFVVLTAICLALAPCLIVVLQKGKRWREAAEQ